MSAIWGCVDLDKSQLDVSLGGRMKKPLEKYKIDGYACENHGNAVMGCGMQYINQASQNEVMPILDEEIGFFLTADCMLDNRAELGHALGCLNQLPPDGELLTRAFRQWGRDCVPRLRGSFAFAAYTMATNTLLLVADHTYSRSLYYCRRGNKIWFSTVIEPIRTVLEPAAKLNERWISDYLSIEFLAFITEPIETIWEGICKPEPAQYLEFTTEGTLATTYWDPLHMPPLKLKEDEAYKQRFLELMDAAAAEIVQTGAQLGIYVSGGLDSSATLAVAAVPLAKAGREIYGYTSVPEDGYKNQYSYYDIVDEREGVMSLAEMYPNFKPHFCAFPGTDAITGAPNIIEFYETPYKSVSNITWMMNIGAQAGKDGCKVVLSGQMGNLTISWGDVRVKAFTLLSKGRVIRAMRELSDYGLTYGMRRKHLMKSTLSGLVPKWARKVPDFISNTYVNKAFAQKHGSEARVREKQLYLGASYMETHQQMRTAFFNPNILTLSGETETKLGLYGGFVMRDLSKDIRIYEFCLSAPVDCFVKDNVGRRLMRGYMKERLPEVITKDDGRRGLQSADWIARLTKRWDEVYATLCDVLLDERMAAYFNLDKLRGKLETYRQGIPMEEEFDFQALFYYYSMAVFLRASQG